MNLVRRQTTTAKLTQQHPEESEWPQKIRDGSLAAFEAMFKAYYQDMVSFAEYHVHRTDVAEELVQEIFLNLWRNRCGWHPRGSLRTYLLGAARNHGLAYLRHKKVEWTWVQRQDDNSQEFTPEDSLRYEELDLAVCDAIDALPERRRIIFSLSRQQGLSYAEIAALMNISPKTVEHQISRALKFLRERLTEFLLLCISLIVPTNDFLL